MALPPIKKFVKRSFRINEIVENSVTTHKDPPSNGDGNVDVITFDVDGLDYAVVYIAPEQVTGITGTFQIINPYNDVDLIATVIELTPNNEVNVFAAVREQVPVSDPAKAIDGVDFLTSGYGYAVRIEYDPDDPETENKTEPAEAHVRFSILEDANSVI